MKKQIYWIFAAVLCMTILLAGCKEWKKYSTEYECGTFAIQNRTPNDVFSPESYVLVTTADAKFSGGFETHPSDEYVFVFYKLSLGVESVTYNHTVERTDVYDVVMTDGTQRSFSLYAYDWSEKIYVENSSMYFKRVDETPSPSPEKPTTPDDPVLDEATLIQTIKEDYIAYTDKGYTADDLTVTRYCSFGETHVVAIRGPWDIGYLYSVYIVDGVIFAQPTFYVYHDGSFYSVYEAYENALLTHDELAHVQQKTNSSLFGYEEAMKVIKRHYVYNYTAFTISDSYCYGIFNDDTFVTLLSLQSTRYYFPEERVTEQVGGVDFARNSNQTFVVYHEGELFSLQEAFENGILSTPDLTKMKTCHEKGWGDFTPEKE